MFATSKASTKLPHCGSAGHESPPGAAAGRMQRGREDAHERQDRDRDQRDEERPAGVELPASDSHCPLPRREALDREDHDQHQDDQDDRQGRSEADLPLEEGEDVDLDARDRCRVARSAAGRDVDDVERGQGGDHGDGDADADLVAQARHRDGAELLEPPGAVEARGLVERRVDLASSRSAAGRCRSRAAPRSR